MEMEHPYSHIITQLSFKDIRQVSSDFYKLPYKTCNVHRRYREVYIFEKYTNWSIVFWRCHLCQLSCVYTAIMQSEHIIFMEMWHQLFRFFMQCFNFCENIKQTYISQKACLIFPDFSPVMDLLTFEIEWTTSHSYIKGI